MTRLLCPAALVLLFAIGGALASFGQRLNQGCSTPAQNLFVHDAMTDLYLWYDTIPTLNPTTFDSPESYLEAIRYRPLDSTFSYITPRAASDAFYSDSQFIGFGLSTMIDGTALRVAQVFAGSPAEEAGLARGDRILEINGRRVSDLIAASQIDGAFGPAEIGVERDILFEHGGADRTGAHMTKRLVTIPTVSLTRVYRVGSRTVGYVFFRNFVEPSFDALDQAFGELRNAGVNELVLDLRYNGGGLVSVAQHLASLIGGTLADGQLMATYSHNDKNAFRNTDLRFQPKANALALDRVVVITTRGSASASELVINALRPYMPVIVVGDRTYGKPVGQYGMAFCDKVLAAVAFSLRNANGEGDFFQGLPPTCPAADDLDHQFGDPAEASLQEAFVFISSGACSSQATETAGPRRTQSPGGTGAAQGWQSVVGAY